MIVWTNMWMWVCCVSFYMCACEFVCIFLRYSPPPLMTNLWLQWPMTLPIMTANGKSTSTSPPQQTSTETTLNLTPLTNHIQHHAKSPFKLIKSTTYNLNLPYHQHQQLWKSFLDTCMKHIQVQPWLKILYVWLDQQPHHIFSPSGGCFLTVHSSIYSFYNPP